MKNIERYLNSSMPMQLAIKDFLNEEKGLSITHIFELKDWVEFVHWLFEEKKEIYFIHWVDDKSSKCSCLVAASSLEKALEQWRKNHDEGDGLELTSITKEEEPNRSKNRPLFRIFQNPFIDCSN